MTSSAKTCLVRSQIGGEEELAESVDGVEVGTTGQVEMEVEKGARKRTPKFANQNGFSPCRHYTPIEQEWSFHPTHPHNRDDIDIAPYTIFTALRH
ncbi:hypothetical protein TB1_033874 [Malus domestica]